MHNNTCTRKGCRHQVYHLRSRRRSPLQCRQRLGHYARVHFRRFGDYSRHRGAPLCLCLCSILCLCLSLILCSCFCLHLLTYACTPKNRHTFGSVYYASVNFAHMHPRTHEHAHAQTHVHTHTHIHASDLYLHTHTHAHTHAYISSVTYTLDCSRS